MHFEPDIDWCADAGLPRRSLAKMGGVVEISPTSGEFFTADHPPSPWDGLRRGEPGSDGWNQRGMHFRSPPFNPPRRITM